MFFEKNERGWRSAEAPLRKAWFSQNPNEFAKIKAAKG